MFLFILFHIFCYITCAFEHIFVENDVMTIVYDRRFTKYKCFNFLNLKEVNLDEDFVKTFENDIFLYNKFFPNPFFAEFNLSELKENITKNKFIIECFTEKRDLLFGFMIENDLENIKVYNFYGPENLKLNFKKFECQKHDYFILSSQEKNFEAINNSLKYLENIKSFDTFFSKFLKLKEICIDDKFDELLVDIYNSGQFGRSFLIEASEVKKAKIDVMNTCFFIYSLLLMPKLNKTNCCKHFDFFGNLIIEAFKSSLYFLESAEDNIKNSQKIDETLKADLMKKLENAIQIVHFKLEDLELNNVFLPVYEIKIKIESLDEFVKDVLEKGNINTQIILDCDVKIIDIFVILYSSLLIEYCNVLESNIEFNFSADNKLESDVINIKYVNSGEFYHDVIIAK